MRLPLPRVEGGRKPQAQPRCLPADLTAAIESATLSMRDDDDEGPRTVVISPAMGGAFLFSREAAAERFRKHFPGLSHHDYSRAIGFLESRVRLLHAPRIDERRRATRYAFSWRESNPHWME